MSVQFHVLASGSSGNACVLDASGFGVLLDFGLSPRHLAPRMKKARVGWERIHAVLLTHTHTDHWQPATLAHLAKLGLPVYCHADHLSQLAPASRAHQALVSVGLLRHYQLGKRFALNESCACVPFEVSHDGGTTCGFRVEGSVNGKLWALGYATDLGCWNHELAETLANVDLLALEFNHDVVMQMDSGRHPLLIRRVLGDAGHLSNEQAGALLGEILMRSEIGRLKHLVQLHLSVDCNRPELAYLAAEEMLDQLGADVSIHTTAQGKAGPTIRLESRATPATNRGRHARAKPPYTQPTFSFAADEPK